MGDNLSKLNLNVFDEIYVQTKGRVSFNTENPPLAFATQTGVGFNKRKETVDQWSGPTYEYVTKLDENGVAVKDSRGYPERVSRPIPMTEGNYLQNTPLSGFTFEKSVSRWSTSNKWFTINDPRGFQLQIAADNLGDILINAGVLKGELQGEYVWARNASNIFLCRTNHPAYIDKIKPKVDRTNLIPGDIILMGQDTTEYEFLGTYYTTRFGIDYRYIEEATGKIMPFGWRAPYSYYGYGNRSPYKNASVLFSTQDDKLVHVFKAESLGLKVMRQKPTKIKILRAGDPTYTLKVGEAYDIWSSLPASNVALFWDSVEDLKEHGPALVDNRYEIIKNATQVNGRTYRILENGCEYYGGDYTKDLATNKDESLRDLLVR